jgi:hypothetical protein
MPISPDRIQRPEVVWAAPDDTLEQVREKLKDPGGTEKWQAFIGIRDENGQYAVVPVLDLRPVLWEEGPAALKRPLLDFAQFRFQPGVEQDSIDLKMAEREAGQQGGYLVVLDQGSYVGLVPGAGAVRGARLKPPGAFDLFDRLITDEILSRTEFVTARLNSTLAKVARDLKSLRDPENAYVIVEKGRDSYGVMSVRQLQTEVEPKQLVTNVWSMPLLQFATGVRDVPSREFTAVSYEQAQALADKHGFLVLTDEGKPVGLLPSGVILRAADLEGITYGVPKGPHYNLLTVPQAVLDPIPPEVSPETMPRVANLWFTDRGGAPVPKDEPLRLRQPYRLQINIGQERPESIVPSEQPPILEPPVEMPEGTRLYVSLFSDDFDIPDPTQPLLLPPWGDSQPVEFEVVPLRRTVGPNEKAALDVHIYYRCNVVQTWQVLVEVVPVGQPAQSDAPQVANSMASRTTDYVSVEQAGPRQLTVVIDKVADGSYRFDFVVAGDEKADEVRMRCKVPLRREDLIHLVTKARRQLYNIARAKAYQQDVAGDARTRKKAMRALALLGRQLYDRLFEFDGPESSAWEVGHWIKEHVPEGSTVQVVDRAQDFVFPWSLIYDEIPWNEDDLSPKVEPDGFWGWRYKVELLTKDLLETYAEAGVEIDNREALQVGIGFNDEIPGATDQRDLFGTLSASCGDRAVYEPFDSSPELVHYLKEGKKHLLYVFCHGFTERMAADIQIGDDLIGEFKAWLGTLSPTERQRFQGQEDSLFNVSDSWIRLSFGEVSLTMMEHCAADRLDYAPLVFLNMCESAQVLPSLSGGFIPFFIQHGARGVIGTECTMTSTFAHPFAEAFFQQFLKGEAVGDILWHLRREFLKKGNPLGFAYTLYCDANAKLREAIL